MAKRAYPTRKKRTAFRRPDGSLRPTWEYRDVEIDGVGKKGFVIGIRGRPECITLDEARDRIDSYHRRRAGQACRRLLDLLETTVRPDLLNELQSPDFADFMEFVAQSFATAA